MNCGVDPRSVYGDFFMHQEEKNEKKCRDERGFCLWAGRARAVEEGVYMDQYDYIIVNDDLDVCVKELDALMQSTHHAVKFNKEFVAAIKDDLKTL